MLNRLIEVFLNRTPAPRRSAELGTSWKDAVLHDLNQMEPGLREAWRALLAFALTAFQARPSRTWLDAAREHLEAVGKTAFLEKAQRWFVVAEGVQRAAQLPGRGNQLRGLVWFCSLLDDAETTHAVGALGLAFYKKIPGVGPRSVKVGNACIYALGAMPGREPIAQLTRLRMRVKDRRGLNAIDAAMNDAATRQGMTPDDLEENAVPTYGLEDGVLRQSLGDYTALLRITGADRTELNWLRPDGKSQKSIPAAIKQEHADAVKTIKKTAKDLRAMLAAQRDRLERLLRTDRSWTPSAWRERYLDHPLLSTLARRLIWQITRDGNSMLVTWHEGGLVDLENQPLAALPESAEVRLWHPINADGETVRAWRHWLEAHAVTQPFKQAHREVYVLTDAERATRTYSNRFAAHILNQHQLNALCRARGWGYRLQGNFDSCNSPTLYLPRWRLHVVFDVEAPFDAEHPAEADLITDMGIFRYVSTDQVRFRAVGEGRGYEPLPLEEVPPLVFSEVMRDVDLFVGVCSIGNDPAWQDRGEADGHARFADYWHDFSFGDLSVSAQMRKEVLESLLPRLAIADRCRLNGRFLVVQGDLRTYKIHLRSANILMEPNDQYLCIVPDARARGRRLRPDLATPDRCRCRWRRCRPSSFRK